MPQGYGKEAAGYVTAAEAGPGIGIGVEQRWTKDGWYQESVG